MSAEQKIIRDLLGRAQRGVGGVVLVDGEPGIGKSSLLRWSTDEAAGQGFSLAAAAEDQLGQVIPFFALSAALIGRAVRGGSGMTGRCHGVADRCDASPSRTARRGGSGPGMPRRLAVGQPLTLAALRTLPRELKRHQVGWLLARSTTPHRTADYLFTQLEHDGAARITLAALDDDAVAAMLTDAFGAPPDQALGDLAHGAAGNPSLVAELIAGLRDDEAVRVADGRRARVCPAAPAHPPARAAAARRPQPPGPAPAGDRGCARAAFRMEDAAEMLGQTPAMLLPAVEEAMDAALMTAAEHSFTFRHELLRRAVGEMIPQPARRRCTASTARSCSPGANRRPGPPATCCRPHIPVTPRRWPGWTRQRRRRCARRRRPRLAWRCARWS